MTVHNEHAPISVQPDWCRSLTLQQQSVLLLAARGPVEKWHPCKNVIRAYRGAVLLAARLGRTLDFGEGADSFMALDRFADAAMWTSDVRNYFASVDSLPHHYQLHLLHGAEILGYKHPDPRFAERWWAFYVQGVDDMHLQPESAQEMDARLSDWGRESWS
jgi:hypothetical protein